jgi:hypothetical protein
MTTIVWIHADNLNPGQPALRQQPDAPAIFVWDEALLAEWKISLKRIVFIYECLLELPVVIRRGDVVQEVCAFAHEHRADYILTAASLSPRHRAYCRAIAAQMPSGTRLEVLRERPFVSVRHAPDLKRFSRYWAAVRAAAMRPGGNWD